MRGFSNVNLPVDRDGGRYIASRDEHPDLHLNLTECLGVAFYETLDILMLHNMFDGHGWGGK